MESPLLLHLERLRIGPVTLDLELPPEDLDLADPEFEFEGPVTGDVTFTLVDKDVLAHGELRVLAQTPCVRCLTPTRVELLAAVDELWVYTPAHGPGGEPPAEDEAPTLTFSGDVIDVTETFRELLMSELPDRTYCREACAGLCPGCGANLNNEPCQCKHEGGAQAPAAATEAQPEWKKALRNLKLSD